MSELFATNRYHTSSSAFPEQPARDCVAPSVVPLEKVHRELMDSKAAFAQLSDWLKERKINTKKNARMNGFFMVLPFLSSRYIVRGKDQTQVGSFLCQR